MPSLFVFKNIILAPFYSFIDEKSKYFDDVRQAWSEEKPKYKLFIGSKIPNLSEVVVFIEQTSKRERCKEGLYFSVNTNEWEYKAPTPPHRKIPYLSKISYIDIRRVVFENVNDLFAKYSKQPEEFAMVAKLPDNKKNEMSQCFNNLPRHNLVNNEQNNIKTLAGILPDDFINKRTAEFINNFYN